MTGPFAKCVRLDLKHFLIESKIFCGHYPRAKCRFQTKDSALNAESSATCMINGRYLRCVSNKKAAESQEILLLWIQGPE